MISSSLMSSSVVVLADSVGGVDSIGGCFGMTSGCIHWWRILFISLWTICSIVLMLYPELPVVALFLRRSSSAAVKTFLKFSKVC